MDGPRSLGRFDLDECVGRGAVGDVYAARDRRTGEQVAIKILRDLTPEGLIALKHEFRAIQGVRHPNLVGLSELFEENGQFFFSMELVDGVSLVEHARADNDNAQPCGARLRRAFAQLASGLSALHAASKVHRDVKSSNVLVDTHERVVLLDFGIALDTDGRKSTGGMAGTILNMAPEQVLDEDVGPAADMYAMGVILYQCLTGRSPFAGRTDDELLVQKLSGTPLPLGRSEIERDPQLAALCMELMQRDPALRPTASQVRTRLDGVSPPAASASGMLRTPFVGRKQELATLHEGFRRAATRAHVVLVRGQSGVGKTCLVQQFVGDLETRDEALVLRGRCYERESLPYKGLDAIVDALAAFLESLPDDDRPVLKALDAELLCQAFPVMRDLFAVHAVSVSGQLVPEQARARTFQALSGLLAAVASRRRMAIVIDDIQWSDADSLALLRVLLEPHSSPPVLWVLMFRTDAAHTVELALPGPVVQLVVERLPDRDAESLARQLLGQSLESTPSEGLCRIVREAQGHPLFISELVQSLEHRRENVGLDEALWARVARLDDAERRLVQALSVAASPIAPEILAHALALTPAMLRRTSIELEAQRLVRSENAGGCALLSPYHDRLRESVLAHVQGAERTRVHHDLARAMEELAQDEHDALAYHWEQAGDVARAVPHLEHAADHARAQLAFERAAVLYQRLRTLRGVPDVETERKLAEAWSNAGYGHAAASVRLELSALLPVDERIDQRRLAAQELLSSGRYDEGIQVLRGAIGDAGFAFPKTPARALFGLVTRRLGLRLRGPRLSQPRAVPDPKLTLQTDVARSACLGLSMVDPISGNYFGVRSVLCALELGDPVRAVHALVVEALAGGGANQKRSARLLAAAHDMARDLSRPDVTAMLHVGVGGLGYFYGDWSTACRELGRAEQILRDHCIGVHFELNNTRFMLYRSMMARGDLPALRTALAPVLRAAEHREDRYMLANLHSTSLVQLALAADQPDEARRHLDHARTLLTERGYHVQHYLCMLSEAQTLLYTGDARAALERVESERPRIQRAMLDRVALVRQHCADLAGRAALSLARDARGTERAQLDARVGAESRRLISEPNRWAHALGNMLLAGRCALRADDAGAEQSLRAGLEGAERAGMTLHVAAAQRALARLHRDDELGQRADAAFAAAELAAPRAYERLLLPLAD